MTEMFAANNSGIEQCTEFIRAYIGKRGIKGRDLIRAVLTAEETASELIAHSDKSEKLRVSVHSFLGKITVDISLVGREFDFAAAFSGADELWTQTENDAEDAIRSLILKAYTKNLRYRHKNGINTVRMTVQSAIKPLITTLAALFAAFLLGTLLSLNGPSLFVERLDKDVLTVVKAMYMNALKMIAAPVVFFSIASCISQFGDLRDIGRIGGKVLGLYMVTTLIAVNVGIGVFYLFRPGMPAAADTIRTGAAQLAAVSGDISAKQIILGIVPSDVISPFLETNMLQLIFIAVLCGAAAGMAKDSSKLLGELLEAGNELFLNMTGIIMYVTPFAVFCSILSMTLQMGMSTLMSLLGVFGTFLFGLLCMLIVYCLLLTVSGLSPFRFLQRYSPAMLKVFSIASSNAAIPINMEFCAKKLMISPKVYKLSIPLGATMNMDGTCVLLAVESLALAKIFGTAVPAAALPALAVSIIALSVGAPGVPGAGIIMLSMLLSQLGVPQEAAALVVGIGPLAGMFLCMTNCLGDAVVTTLVAKSEKLIDIKAYKAE